MIVAEIGINHKGSETKALKMLKALIDTKVNAVTFQIPRRAFYAKVKKYGGPLRTVFYKKAIHMAHKGNKLIGFAIQDIAMISVLNRCGANFWKTVSGDITDNKLQAELQKTRKLTFISTGLSGENDILKVSKRYRNIKFIHTRLSPDASDVNLSAIKRIRELTGKNTAFGLHSALHEVLYLALAFGPSDIFFYVKDNKHEKYPDDKHAFVINEVDKVIGNLEKLKKAIGGIPNTPLSALKENPL